MAKGRRRARRVVQMRRVVQESKDMLVAEVGTGGTSTSTRLKLQLVAACRVPCPLLAAADPVCVCVCTLYTNQPTNQLCVCVCTQTNQPTFRLHHSMTLILIPPCPPTTTMTEPKKNIRQLLIIPMMSMHARALHSRIRAFVFGAQRQETAAAAAAASV